MLPLIIACSVFNDKDNLKRHLSTIPQYIHHQILDGRYKGFNYPSDLSDDGTREIASTFFNTQIIDVKNHTEVEKRQKYFDSFNNNIYKFLLVADSDEYFQGDWCDFIIELDDLYEKYKNGNIPVCIGINVMNPLTKEFDLRPRIWLNAQNVIMGPRHNEFKSKLDGSGLYAIYEIENMKLNHNYSLRYPSYDELRRSYQINLIEQESTF